MKKDNIRKLVLAVAALAGVFATSIAFANNPGTFVPTAAWQSGTVGADNMSQNPFCFVVASWNTNWGFTSMTVTNNGGGRWSPSGMAYSGAVQVECTNNNWYTGGFSTSQQSVTTPACPWPYTPKAWDGYLWSWTDNGCVD